MRYHWLRDREVQGQFRFYWPPGTQNWADCWTKHHPAAHHRQMRENILTPVSRLEELRRRVHGVGKTGMVKTQQDVHKVSAIQQLRGCAKIMGIWHHLLVNSH